MEYRRAVAAYAVAHALAGEALSGFGFTLRLARVVAVAIETDEHADDVRVMLLGGLKAQVQAKRTLCFGAVLRGAVAQWNAAAKTGLDPVRDRLVLVTGSASGPVLVLARALERCKTDEPGAFTAEEQKALTRLDQMLSGLTEQQRELVRRCAVITVLDVEEEQSPGAALARLLLGRVVGGGEVVVRAWRDLVAHCGRVGRLRGGFGVEGWMRLLQEEGYRVAGDETPAATAGVMSTSLLFLHVVRTCRARDLDVGRAISVPNLRKPPLPELPPFLFRPHDDELREAMEHPGFNPLIFLIGKTTVGRTRSMYEALIAVLPDWKVVRPRNSAELITLARPGFLPPQTVVWLDEAEYYLDGADPAGVVHALRALLRSNGPVLVLGSLRAPLPDRFVRLPDNYAGDLHRETRELLQQAVLISVPDALTEDELKVLDRPEMYDPRWIAARAASGDDRRVVQILGGGTALALQYDNDGNPGRRALHTTVVDVHRLGLQGPVPLTLLRAATMANLTPEQRVAPSLSDFRSWFDSALADSTTDLNGVSALSLVRTGTGIGSADAVVMHPYLVQHGAARRRSIPVPSGTWEALIAHTAGNADRVRVAWEAYGRGLWRIAALTAAPAAHAGDLDAIRVLEQTLRVTEQWEEAMKWRERAVELGNAHLIRLQIEYLERLDSSGSDDQREVVALLLRLADAGDADAMHRLAVRSREAGDEEQVLVWLRRAAAAGYVHASYALHCQGMEEEAIALLRTAAAVGHGDAMGQLVVFLDANGQSDEAERWRQRMARCKSGSLNLMVDRDMARSEQLWRDAAASGSTNAKRFLADYLLYRKKDPESALELLAELAQQGDREMTVKLAETLEQCGRLLEAEELRLRMVETGAYGSGAVFELAWYYQQHDPDRGRQVMRRLADSQDAEAAWCNSLHFAGERGSPEERDWVWRAASLGHMLAIRELSYRLQEETSEAYERWVRNNVPTHGDHAGNLFGLLYSLVDVLKRTGRAHEADLLHRYGLEPDGSTTLPWDTTEVLYCRPEKTP